jgi:hypothetical protein
MTHAGAYVLQSNHSTSPYSAPEQWAERWRGSLRRYQPEGFDGRSLALGLTTSGAECVASWAPDARVVKAFNHVYAEVLSSPKALSRGVTLFVCGDDRDARRASR